MDTKSTGTLLALVKLKNSGILPKKERESSVRMESNPLINIEVQNRRNRGRIREGSDQEKKGGEGNKKEEGGAEKGKKGKEEREEEERERERMGTIGFDK